MRIATALADVAPATANTTATRTDVLGLLVLARIAAAAGPVRRVEVVRDLAVVAGDRSAPDAARLAVETAVSRLAADRLIEDAQGRLQPTGSGRRRLDELLTAAGHTCDSGLPAWPFLRDTRLVAMALELRELTPSRLKALLRPDVLRAAVVQRAYGLKLKGVPTPARLRKELAVLALGRAFGDRLKERIGSSDGMSAKAGRLLAAELAAKPRRFGTDARLVAALAAEAVGAKAGDAGALRLAVLRRWVTGSVIGDGGKAQADVGRPLPLAIPAREPPLPPAASRPDLAGFAREVCRLAKGRADGWPGNRKTLISHVWQEIVRTHAEWGLSEVEFKAMLVEAHRTGNVVLAGADLKSKDNLKDFQQSAVSYKNTVWHFVRVED
jgi:hypothetical protein